MCNAVDMLCLNDAGGQQEQSGATGKLVLEGPPIRDVILKAFLPVCAPERQKKTKDILSSIATVQDWTASLQKIRQNHAISIEADLKLQHLDHSQIRAIATILGKRVSLIQGVS